MTNTSNLPLEIRHDRIDSIVLEAIQKIDEAARKHDTAYFLAGATAREITLRHVLGRPPGRCTMDVDLGIAVRDWDHFQLLKSALVEQGGFQPHARMVQRLIYPSKPLVRGCSQPVLGKLQSHGPWVRKAERACAFSWGHGERWSGHNSGKPWLMPLRDATHRKHSTPQTVLVAKVLSWRNSLLHIVRTCGCEANRKKSEFER